MTGRAKDIFRTHCAQTPSESTCSEATVQPDVRSHMFSHNPKTILSSSMTLFVFLLRGNAFEMEPVGAKTSFSLRKHIQTAELTRLQYSKWYQNMNKYESHKFRENTTQVKKKVTESYSCLHISHDFLLTCSRPDDRSLLAHTKINDTEQGGKTKKGRRRGVRMRQIRPKIRKVEKKKQKETQEPGILESKGDRQRDSPF